MRRWLVLVAGCWLLAAPKVQAADVGVLVLAHGGTPQWNQTIEQTVAQAKLAYPTQIAFGMGMHEHEVAELQRAIETLERGGASRIVVVPLLVSSASDVMRQLQYLLGLRDRGPWEAHAKPVKLRARLVMTPPLDDDPVVIDVLVARALELSKSARGESVLVVAHGPVSDEDSARWLSVMERVAKRVQAIGHFRAVIPVTLRDDAPKRVQDDAAQHLRELVREQGEQGRVVVVPLLLSNGGIEEKIPQRLKWLSYVYKGQALLPDPKLAQWIAHRVEAALKPPSS